MANSNAGSRAAKKAAKEMDARIEAAYYRHAFGVQVNIFDLSKIFNEGREAIAKGFNIDDAMRDVIIPKYRINPKGSEIR